MNCVYCEKKEIWKLDCTVIHAAHVLAATATEVQTKPYNGIKCSRAFRDDHDEDDADVDASHY
jgi:hypothetical protein